MGGLGRGTGDKSKCTKKSLNDKWVKDAACCAPTGKGGCSDKFVFSGNK